MPLFARQRNRLVFLEAARRWCVPFVILHCQAEPGTVRTRLEERRGDVSDADWTVYLQAARTWEAAGPVTKAATRVVSTEGDPAQVVERARRELVNRELC